MTAAETVGQVFLGVRLQCARCHNHPFDVWTQDDYYGLAAYFGNVARKEVNNVRRDKLDTHEINGDEMIYLSGQPETVQPRTGAMMEPKPPAAPSPSSSDDPDALDDLADWLTRNNRQFARNMANRDLVPPDRPGRRRSRRRLPRLEPPVEPRAARRPDRPSSSPAGCGSGRWSALIMKSQTYQLGSQPNATNADDEANFARASVRLLPAEVLLDAIGQALGKPESFANAPGRAARRRSCRGPGWAASSSRSSASPTGC